MGMMGQYLDRLREFLDAADDLYAMPTDVAESIDGWEEVSHRTLNTYSRWYNFIETVYTDGNEFLAVVNQGGKTEYQDSMTIFDSDPDVYLVKPHEVTKIEYRKV